MKKSIYNDIRTVINKYIKRDYWKSFSSADIFHFTDSKGNNTLVTFIDSFFGESYGLQFFTNNDGFNYVHDIFTSENPDMITIGDCDSICAILVSKENLNQKEIAFLKENKIRIKEENNLLIYRFKKGFGQRMATDKELSMVVERLGYLTSIIENEYNDIIKAFNDNLSVVAYVDLQMFMYHTNYVPLPYLEHNPGFKKEKEDFVLEYKDKMYYNDDCYVFTSYLPIVIKETGVRPLLVYFYYNNTSKSYIKFIIDEPKDYKQCIYGILDDVFTTIGMPTKMIFNNRDLYYICAKTLKKLNIECEKTDNNEYVDDNVSQVVAKLYEKTQDEEISKEDAITILNDTIATVINSLDSPSLIEKIIDNSSNLIS